jgi:hypothetical protein
MGIFDIFKKSNDAQVLPEAEAPEPKVKKPRKPSKPKVKKEKVLTEKEKATAAGEPYVNIIKMEVDPNNIHAGAFDLDWNDKFLINLIRAGYKLKEDDTDVMIVDRWFQNVCRNVALEIYEQQQADPTNREVRPITSRDIGNGRSEVS